MLLNTFESSGTLPAAIVCMVLDFIATIAWASEIAINLPKGLNKSLLAGRSCCKTCSQVVARLESILDASGLSANDAFGAASAAGGGGFEAAGELDGAISQGDDFADGGGGEIGCGAGGVIVVVGAGDC
jgi:hypothetical protein